MFDNKTLPK